MKSFGLAVICLFVPAFGIGIFVGQTPVWSQDPAMPPPVTARQQLDPPQAQPREGFVFCVFGACRPSGSPRAPRITRTLAEAMAGEYPSLALGTGDFIDGARTLGEVQRQYEVFFRSIGPLQNFGPVPLAAAPGHRDILGSRANADLFIRYFGGLYYSFEYENCHFIVLDTEDLNAPGRIDGEQYRWLYHDLESAQSAEQIFVVLHRPLFPVATQRGNALDRFPPQRDRLHALFVQFNVSAVFAGHEHLYNYQRRDEVDYFITGGGGAPLYVREEAGGFYHYLAVEVNKDAYTVSAKRISVP